MKKKKRKIKKKYIRRAIVVAVALFIIGALVLTGVLIYRIVTPYFSKDDSSGNIVAKPEQYEEMGVDELGEIPVLMYHSVIHSKTSDETEYTGGNVDEGGFERTADAFRKDLEFYYQNGYQCIRLEDYVDGKINCDAGKTPLVLTFDDGNANNCWVKGEDEEGNIIINKKCVIGILEEFKEKYPDFHVTATFFITWKLFQQPEYNEKILSWLVDNGYDVGNHTRDHIDFTTIGTEESETEVGFMYDLFDQIIPDKYVKIVALPYGSPYAWDHENIPHILTSTYNGKTYKTKSLMRVNWKANESPFLDGFEPRFIKRIRGYDNDGQEFDIEQSFKELEKTRYISDGNPDTIVIPSSKKDLIGKYQTEDKQIIEY